MSFTPVKISELTEIAAPTGTELVPVLDGTTTKSVSINGIWSVPAAGTFSGNLTFTGTGNRIIGDFSTSTVANRVMFQTSTTNGPTSVYAIPNGTSTVSQFVAAANADPTNTSVLQLQANSTDYRLVGGITGTGTYLPMTFYTGGSERVRISTSGTLTVGRTGGFTGAETTAVNGYATFGNTAAPQVIVGDTGASTGVVGTYSNHPVEFRTNNTERMRIDSSGNINVATTGARITGDFSNATASNRVMVETSTASSATLFGIKPSSGAVGGSATSGFISYGSSADVNNASTMAIAVNGGVGQAQIQSSWTGGGSALPITIWTSNVERLRIETLGHVTPGADNSQNFGSGGLRWATIYAGTGTINTSDAREKTQVRSLTENEINAAKQLSKEIGAYKWLSAIESKGESARTHIGLTVQRAIEVMQSFGLDAMAYGFICYDQWDDKFFEHPAEEAKEATFDEEGNELTPAVEAKEAWTEQTQFAGDRYSFRMDELNLFLARGFEARLSALEGV